MPTHDPYETLQVHPKAETAAIDAAYTRLLEQYAPERLAGAAPELRELAERKREVLDEAYAMLSDPARRAAFDAEYKPAAASIATKPAAESRYTTQNSVLNTANASELPLDYRPLPPAGHAERPRGFDDQPYADAGRPAAARPVPPAFIALLVAAMLLAPALVFGVVFTSGGFAQPGVVTPTLSPADQFEPLIAQARTAAEQNPDDARAWIDYANLLYDSAQIVREQAPASVLYQQRLPRWLDAIVAYNRALELDPSNAVALADKGASSCFYGSDAAQSPYVEQGLADTTLAFEQAPEEPRVLLSHGYCLVSATPPQTEAAIAVWRKIPEIVPADSPLAGQASELITQYSQQ